MLRETSSTRFATSTLGGDMYARSVSRLFQRLYSSNRSARGTSLARSAATAITIVGSAGCQIRDDRGVSESSNSLVPHDQPAIDVDGLPGHVVGIGAGQEGDDVRDVLGLLRPPERDGSNPALPGLAHAQP